MGSLRRVAVFVAGLAVVAATLGSGQAAGHAKGLFAGAGPGTVCPFSAYPVLAGEINVQGLLVAYSNSHFAGSGSCLPGHSGSGSLTMYYHGLPPGGGIASLHQGLCTGTGSYHIASKTAATMSLNGSCSDFDPKTGKTVSKPAHFNVSIHVVRSPVVAGTVTIS